MSSQQQERCNVSGKRSSIRSNGSHDNTNKNRNNKSYAHSKFNTIMLLLFLITSRFEDAHGFNSATTILGPSRASFPNLPTAATAISRIQSSQPNCLFMATTSKSSSDSNAGISSALANTNGGGKTLSTKHILYPEIYLSQKGTLSQMQPPLFDQGGEDEQPLPLFAALRSLTHALEMILQQFSSSSSSSSSSMLLDHLDTTTMLRIEVPIAAIHSTDPLCWLHAQQPFIQKFRRKQSSHDATTNSNPNENDKSLPVLYFNDAEGNVEAAVVGKSSPYSFSDSWDPFVGKRIWDNVNTNGGGVGVNGNANASYNNGDTNGDTNPMLKDDNDESRQPMLKEGDLPPGSRVYGGSRFDWRFYQEKRTKMQNAREKHANNKKEKEDMNSNMNKIGNENMEADNDNDANDDWDGFGGDRGGYWILPAVELRREIVDDTTINSNGNAGGTERDSDKFGEDSSMKRSSGGMRKVTLAVHLHNLSSSSSSSSEQHPRQQTRQQRHSQGWHDAALRTLAILRELTDELSPAVPCTTLPPVLTRSESTGKGKEDSGDHSGYAFERAVTEALRQIHSNDDDCVSTDEDTIKSSSVSEISDDKLQNGLGEKELINKNKSFRKVVLARKVDLNLGSTVNGLDVLMRMKFGGNVGHIFYLNTGEDVDGCIQSREFLGCTPERLFRVKGSGRERVVTSEALAGTRIRGLTPTADAELLRDLLSSKKDMLENEITGQFIRNALQELEENGWLEKQGLDESSLESPDYYKNSMMQKNYDRNGNHRGQFFVRRLRHLMHICQTFEGRLSKNANVIDVSRSLLQGLHPTPAVCGDSPTAALEFIRKFETLASFDRGYYAGPFGYIGHDSADIVVGIRSALVTNYRSNSKLEPSLGNTHSEKSSTIRNHQSKVSVFAGAGIVDGSTVQGEWTETSHKLGVMSSLFPPSPITLQSFSMPNVAWSTAFIEELVRCGVTQFYICPGSRNTPLTAAIYKSMRSNVGVVRAVSVHDERGAGFRALGYARQNGRPAAVVTSSGTAVANLYPSVVESSADGVPLLVLTADRPYESRDTGSNQSIDQVKIFSSSYVRWFRDIPPPSDDVPVSLALSDAGHAVTLTKQLMGPVHLNIQFRENLAPDAGLIRNDDRIGSVTNFHTLRFTDVPGFVRWSQGGNRWLDTYYPNNNIDHSVLDVAELILQSRRGIIVTGNLRSSGVDGNGADSMSATIEYFAKLIGMPILAGVQSGALRREHSVVPYAEHILKHPSVSMGLQPDLILQLGTPLISTEISKIISDSIRRDSGTKHVLVQRFFPYERADPDFTVTHRISSDIGVFLKSLTSYLESLGPAAKRCSELTPLLYLGRELQKEMPSIIEDASHSVNSDVSGDGLPPNDASLIEPQVMTAISEVLSETSSELSTMSLFLSNSMPVRDGEFFMYPTKMDNSEKFISANVMRRFPLSVNVNRGASGIDGIISTATGCGDAFSPTTLVCGDVTSLHDLNALYGLTPDFTTSNNAQSISTLNRLPLTTIIVNNGGGAIFSFLPIAKHGQDVGFEEFWGTPTRNFSFQQGVQAFGLPYKCAKTLEELKLAYRTSILSGAPVIIEAKVVGRSTNVDVHQQITRSAFNVVDKLLKPASSFDVEGTKLPIKQYTGDLDIKHAANRPKTLLLLHGWMGDKSEWDSVAEGLIPDLAADWNIVSIDLPGHGESSRILSSDQQIIRMSLGIDNKNFLSKDDLPSIESPFSLDGIARTVCQSLRNDHGVTTLDAIAGYSLGGRIALAMKRLCSMSLDTQERTPYAKNSEVNDSISPLVTDQTRLILLSANPGKLPLDDDTHDTIADDKQRLDTDFSLAQTLLLSFYRSYLISNTDDLAHLTIFLSKWYSNKSLWGDLRQRDPEKYHLMLNKRLKNIADRRQEIASVLFGCSPPRTSQDDWKAVVPAKTFYVSGGLDKKYSTIGRRWEKMRGVSKYVEIANAGHATIVEEPRIISSVVIGFLNDEDIVDDLTLNGPGATLGTPSASTNAVEVSARLESARSIAVGVMEYESFSIAVGSSDGSEKGVLGIGWGDSARLGSELKRREGFIISIASRDGMAVGVGEVSPLKGLHKESLEEAARQLSMIKDFLSTSDTIHEQPSFYAHDVLSLNGTLSRFVQTIMDAAGIDLLSAAASVRSGLEMAILSVASQNCGSPLPQSLAANYWPKDAIMTSYNFGQLPVNGLITRGENSGDMFNANKQGMKKISFQSFKVKVGHKNFKDDALSIIRLKESSSGAKIRADANRAWNLHSALEFVDEIKRLDKSVLDIIEFVEEPLEKQMINEKWSFDAQVSALEAFTTEGGVRYALDESLADLAEIHSYDFNEIAADLRNQLSKESGCAAFVLKPALLGLELSMQLANIAQQEFKLNAVFSSSFDSGIGLAYTSILAAVADKSPFAMNLAKFSHGVGTFSMLGGDTLSPSFESYVSEDGMLNVASLSRALYGLSLDEISDRLPVFEATSTTLESAITPNESETYLATTSTSTSGRDITVSVTLPLPFSDGVASSRFTDLPQMSRWSPWLNSVTYLDTAGLTEWNLNIRGVKFSWKAKSEVLNNPKGIKWESISGLKNRGIVEFEQTSHDSCIMKLKMSIIMPYILVSLFQGIPSVVQEFLQNKLLKWSLEMFRDSVKADLALERGDIELGDALFGAVEGRANALEEALK